MNKRSKEKLIVGVVLVVMFACTYPFTVANYGKEYEKVNDPNVYTIGIEIVIMPLIVWGIFSLVLAWYFHFTKNDGNGELE